MYNISGYPINLCRKTDYNLKYSSLTNTKNTITELISIQLNDVPRSELN